MCHRTYPSSVLNESNAFLDLGKYTQAIQYYDKALSVDPNYKEALNNKGNALYVLRDYAQAIPYFDKVLAIDPNYKQALNNKGNALSVLGNYTQAIQYYDNALAKKIQIILEGKVTGLDIRRQHFPLLTINFRC